MNKTIKITIATIIGILLLMAAIVFYKFNPEEISIFPKCPFLIATGYKCPGCGTQRAIHDLLNLNVGSAISHNVYIMFAIPYIMTGAFLELFDGRRKFSKLQNILFDFLIE